jgi:hypothetical protein
MVRLLYRASRWQLVCTHECGIAYIACTGDGSVDLTCVSGLSCAERAIALESLEHNAAANDAAVAVLNENAGLGLETDSAFASKSGGNAADNDAEVEEGLGLETDTAFAGHSGGNAADNDAEVEEGLGLETDTAFAGHSGGNAADNDAEVDSTVGEQADDFFGGDADKKAARSDDASAPRNYLAGMDYKAPNYLQGSGW